MGVVRRRKTGLLSRLADYLSVASLILAVALAAAYFGRIGEQEYTGRFVVMDGDSLEMDGIRFRLEGIDAPEARQTCRKAGADWPCGREAARYLRKLVDEGGVVCTSLGLDKYERILARCETGSREINREMVAGGWAVSFGGYFVDEALARDKKLGVWAGDFMRPGDWREIHGDALESSGSSDWLDAIAARMRMVWQWMSNF